MNIQKVIEKGEGLTVDFKVKVPGDLGRFIASFASTEGGTILVGIDNNRNVIGIEPSKMDQVQQMVDGAIQNIHPSCDCDYEEIKIDGKHILAVKVKKGSRPIYYYSHRAYIREGTSSRPAKPEEVEQLVIDFYFVQGLRAVHTELKTICKIVERRMAILEIPIDAWGRLVQTVSSGYQDNLVERLADMYSSIMVWNSHGKIISTKVELENNFNIINIMDGPIGRFCSQRDTNLTSSLKFIINEIDEYFSNFPNT